MSNGQLVTPSFNTSHFIGTPLGIGFGMTVSNNRVELKTGRHWKTKEGILHSEFFVPVGCPMVDSRMIREHIQKVAEFIKEEKIPFLIDMTSSENVLSFDALKKWGESQELNEKRTVEAYVVSSLADLIFLKQHIRLNKLGHVAGVFTSRSMAIAWLTNNKNIPPTYN